MQGESGMAREITLLLHNDIAAGEIRTGARHVGCAGARPPMDHPHVYYHLEEGGAVQCSYCSTIIRHDPSLPEDACEPAAALLERREG